MRIRSGYIVRFIKFNKCCLVQFFDASYLRLDPPAAWYGIECRVTNTIGAACGPNRLTNPSRRWVGLLALFVLKTPTVWRIDTLSILQGDHTNGGRSRYV